jgi:serine/threonine protein kinase
VPLKPGDRIERYVIDALLGHGGMGEVYRAHDARLQRSVALKILHVDPAGKGTGSSSSSKPHTDGAARMLREARAAAALDHPNVVAIYDVGQVDEPETLRGTTYLAMELIKGATLRSYVGDARVTMKERVRWLSDVARALAAAHAAGLVHRDVKPENVMIRDDGRVKVLDFGIAKRAASDAVDATSSTEGYVVPTLTGQGVIVGTPLYMAPEQLRAEALDGRCDQFAWGVVAYEVLTGKPPWSVAGGSIALVSQILSAPPPPIAPEANVSPDLTRIVTRALAKDRAERFESMDAVLTALEGPVSPYADTSAFAPVSAASAPPGSSTGPRIVVSRPPEVRAPEQKTQADAAFTRPKRRLARPIAVGAIVVAGATFAVGVGLRAREKERAAQVAASAKAAIPAGCVSNRACVESHEGKPYLCRASDHACVAIDSQDCKAMYEPGDLVADDTVWLGALLPRKGPQASTFGAFNLEGVDFARKEIAQATSVLEGAGASQRVRAVALVECDDSEDAMRAARHLVDDVGSPAIIGFRSGQELIDVTEHLLVQRGVLAVASLSSSPLITRLPQPLKDPRLVWRTTFSYDAVAEATAHLVHDELEPRLSRARHTRVMLVHTDAVSSTSFADTFYRELVLNGKPALDSGRDYQEITTTARTPEEIARLAGEVLAADPNIVIPLLTPDTTPEFIDAVETRSVGANHPTYVIANGYTAQVMHFVGSNAERRHRVFAVMSLSNSTPNARFVIRYNQGRSDPVSRVINPGSSYDAFYLLAYGIFALDAADPPNGSSIARAFARLVPPGKPIEVGPTSVLEALGLLRSGQHIDLEGTQSGLDFDLSTGEAPADFALLCPGIDANGSASGDDIESGAVYLAKMRRSEGTMRCP